MKSFSPVLVPILISLFAISIQCNTSTTQKAELIITNANIWTGSAPQPRAEAMAIAGDTIIAIGANTEILKFKSASTETLDARGRFITSGFIDSHVHFIGGGFNLSSVQLRDAQTPAEFISRIASYAQTLEPGTWILGGEWDGSDWSTLPHRSWIDSVTRHNPVFVTRLDGHMALANSIALEKAGITHAVKAVEGGTIVRDKNDALTGILKDNAMNLIFDFIPPPDARQVDEALQAAMRYVASQGVTSVHHVWDVSDPDEYAKGFERAHKNSSLITRIYHLSEIKEWKKTKEQVEAHGPGDKWLKTDGLKGFVDGSLGSQTAAFYDPFIGQPDNSGFFINSEEDLTAWITHGHDAGLQLAVHAIGDKAINFLLNTYEAIQKQTNTKDQRFRIEHAQHIHKNDISRFAELNVIAAMQPYHAIDDGRWAGKYLDQQRLNTTYAFRSLFDSKAVVAFGSDWPVAPASPLWGIYAAVTRRTLDDKNPDGWVPEQKITVEEALIAYTRNAAYASFDENIKGTLEPGKLADFVMISEDLTKVDPVRIKDLQILQTYVGGNKVFDIAENQ